MKSLFAVILGLGMTASAFAGEITTYPYNTASATESDRNQAIEEATEQATSWANSQCIGEVTNTTVSVNGVINIGSDESPNYMATVTVKDTCVTHYGR